MSVSPLLALEHVDTCYGPSPILQDINVEIAEGEIVCLLGGNASGKSTTLKTILGLVQPTRGTVTFRGWQVNTVAHDAMFDPPAGLPEKEVDRQDLYRMFSAMFNFAVESAQ